LPAIEVVDTGAMAARLAAAVREAGALALAMSHSPLNQWIKGAGSPVSDADIAVNDLLRRRLTADTPEIGWLSEESPDDPARLAQRRIWIVDPIDGTRGYLAGSPDWAVSAALIEDGRPIVACLYAPVTEEFFMAVAKAGATRNGIAIRAKEGAALTQMRIAGPRGFLEKVRALVPDFIAVARIHSLALRLARVAQGEIEVAFAGANSHDWDLAAADLLVHEAGGALTSFGGGAVIYNRPVPRHGTLLAAGRDRHARLIELLGEGRVASS
jgi:myo-inositol-1(or 4)-monophosphatase